MARGFHLTIDEWFYHWFADKEKYKEATRFFLKIFDVCDKIALKKNTPLAHKFYQLTQESGKWPIEQREAVRIIKNLFLANSNKVHWVEDDSHFEEEISNLLPRKDVYLIEICVQTVNKILITSDDTLHLNVSDLQNTIGVRSFLVNDFIKKYMADENISTTTNK